MNANARALTSTRLLYPEYRTKLITERMHRSLAEKQERREVAGWLRLIYRCGRRYGLMPAQARSQAHASVTAPLPF